MLIIIGTCIGAFLGSMTAQFIGAWWKARK
jgi:hypothetical protein